MSVIKASSLRDLKNRINIHDVVGRVVTLRKAGGARFKGIRRNNDSHQIEEVGAKLRGMMPWIAKNKLVDTAKN